MKKQLLFSFAFFCSAVAIAQNGEQPAADTKISDHVVSQLNEDSKNRLAKTEDREEIEGWVSFERTVYENVYGPTNFFTYGQVVTPDSLPRVMFSSGGFNSFIHAFGQLFDPTAEDMNASDTRLSPDDSYQIDSIGFPCFYDRVNHNGIDDTLIITVAVTDKETEGVNPYDGSFLWDGAGLLSDEMRVISPSYLGTPADDYHYGLTGTSGGSVNIEVYKFALTEADTEISFRAFPVDVSAAGDQVVYTYVEFKPSFVSTFEDTAFVFDGATGEANTNSFRTIYDFPVDPETGYWFDLYREDNRSYNASYVTEDIVRYNGHTGDQVWRNNRLSVYSWWGFRFEYYMTATSSLSIAENDAFEFSIFPNPVSDQVTINYNEAAAENATLLITDLMGKVVSAHTLTGNQLQLNINKLELSAGTYLVTIQNGNSSSVKKLIVQ